jgi:hypothetical protein
MSPSEYDCAEFSVGRSGASDRVPPAKVSGKLFLDFRHSGFALRGPFQNREHEGLVIRNSQRPDPLLEMDLLKAVLQVGASQCLLERSNLLRGRRLDQAGLKVTLGSVVLG